MVRGNMMRLTVALTGLTLAVAGCRCDENKPPVTCADAIITFEQPLADATVDAPFDVSIVSRTADGTAFPFDSASLRVGGMTFTGEVSGNRATFTGVTATAGAQELSAAIAAGSCSQTGKQTVTVRGTSCTTPAVTAVKFPQDVDLNQVLNGAELGGGAIQVRVEATCVSGVQVRIRRGSGEVGPLTPFLNGAAVVTLDDADPADGTYELLAELQRADGSIVSPSSSAAATIRVSRAAPQVSVTTSGVSGPNGDAEPNVPGYQKRVFGTAPVNSVCEFEVDGVTAGDLMPDMGGVVSADFTLPAATASYTVTLRCTDAAGNTGSATGMFRLLFDAPTVGITSPASTDGGADMVVTESPLNVTIATSAEDGSAVTVTRDGTLVGAGSVVNGAATFAVPFGTDGDYTLVVVVTDPFGNSGSATLRVVVDLEGCGLVFTRPASASVLLTPSQLTGGAYAFQTASDPLCAGFEARLYRADRLADGGVGTEQQVATATLSSSGVADFPPLAQTNGDFRYRGEVSNPADAGVSFATVQVAVDLDGPVITNPVVPSGQPAALITAAQDTAQGVPGVQRTLAFSARVPVGGRVDVCITQGFDGMGPLTGSPECGAGYFLLRQGVTSPATGFTFPEGEYDMKIVVADSGVTPAPASAAIHLLVDGTRPCVQGLTRSLPQDTNGDGRLNLAELAGGPPRLEFTLGCGDTSAATLAATGAVVVRDIVGGAAGAARASTTTFSGAVATVTLTGPYTAEVDLNLFVELTDHVGNKNLLAATGDPATFTFRVDPVAPACAVTAPSQASLGIAQVPGGNLDVQIGTSADVGTDGVTVTFTGQAARSLTPNLSTASTVYALSGDATYAIGATCVDQSGNSSTATPRSVRVDLVAPTCAITAPANDAMSSAKDVLTTVTVGGVEAGAPVTVTSSAAGISNNILTVDGAGTQASGTVSYPNGAQTLTATVADDSGNPCTTAPVNFTVNSSACNLAFAASGAVTTNGFGSWLNRAGAALPEQGATPSSAAVAVAAVTSDCGAGKNVYLYAGAPSATPGGAPVVTDAGGVATFASRAFNEGAQYTVTIDNGSGELTHRSFTVSLKAPTVAGLTLQRSATVTTEVAVAKDAALVFGAAQGNRRVETATAGELVFGDLDATTADAQLKLGVSGIDGANVGAFQARLEVLEGTTALMPAVSVTATPFTPSLPVMKLGHRADDSATSLVVRVTSPAGNTYTSTHAALVDVIAPAVPTVTRNLTSARAATVELQWGAVYDDGTDPASGGLTGGTPAAGYDVRWTTSSVPTNNQMAAAADYFGSSSKAEGVEAWQAGTTTKALTLPPLNTYYIAVRARDEVGNYSAFAAPAEVANPWISTTIVAPVASSNFGASLAIAALIGNDSSKDLVVSATTEASIGAVYVYNSSIVLSNQTGCGTGCQRLAPSDSVAGVFGSDLSAGGNLGDVGAEVLTDLVVSQTWSASGNGGRVVLFFGTTSTTLSVADSIELRGDTNNRIGSSAQIIGDLDGDGLAELAIAAPQWNSNQGRLFIYKGRSRAAWVAARSETDPETSIPYIPVSAATADMVIDGPSPLLTATGNAFGQARRGLVSTIDFDGDGRRDLAVPTSRSTINRLRVFPSSLIAASSGTTPLIDNFRLEISEPPSTDSAISSGVGTFVHSANVIGSSQEDLVVSYPGAPGGGQLLFFDGLSAPTTPTLSPAVTTRLVGPLSFGQCVSVGRFDGDAFPDLVSGTVLTENNAAWIVYQHGGQFDAAISGSFWVSKLDATAITGNTSSRLGAVNALEDFSGDGFPELVLSDSLGSTVRVWRE